MQTKHRLANQDYHILASLHTSCRLESLLRCKRLAANFVNGDAQESHSKKIIKKHKRNVRRSILRTLHKSLWLMERTPQIHTKINNRNIHSTKQRNHRSNSASRPQIGGKVAQDQVTTTDEK